MDFLRRNLFYVAVIAGTVVLGAVLLMIKMPLSASNEESVKVRANLLDRLSRFGNSRERINEKVIAREQERVGKVLLQANNVAQMTIDLNRGEYMKLLLRYSNDTSPAVFPLNTADYDKNGQFHIINYYLAKLEELRKQANFTVRPTDAEFKAEEARQAAAAAGAAPTPAGTPPMGGPPNMGMAPPSVGGPAPVAPPPAGVPSSAPAMTPLEKAMIIVKMQKAMQGRIYIDDAAMDKVFATAVMAAPVSKSWEMQINLWVQGDILAAINQTNEQVLRPVGKPAKKDCVMNSAVKRLEQMKVNTAYVGSTAAPTPAGGGAAPAPVVAPPYGGGGPPYGGGGPPYGGGGPPYGGGGPPYGGEAPGGYEGTGGFGATAGPSLVTPVGAAIGDRACNKSYDVIRYSFQVIMPARHVTALMRNLMARNLHTVLNVEMTEVVEEPNSPFYYGTEPVMHVMIDGQLLLLAAWERGMAQVGADGRPVLTADGKKVYKYEPLMPVDVLKTLPATALRQEDSERVSAAPK